MDTGDEDFEEARSSEQDRESSKTMVPSTEEEEPAGKTSGSVLFLSMVSYVFIFKD